MSMPPDTNWNRRYSWDEVTENGKRMFLVTSTTGSMVVRIYLQPGTNEDKVREYVTDLCARLNNNHGRLS